MKRKVLTGEISIQTLSKTRGYTKGIKGVDFTNATINFDNTKDITFADCTFEQVQIKNLNIGLTTFKECQFNDVTFNGYAESNVVYFEAGRLTNVKINNFTKVFCRESKCYVHNLTFSGCKYVDLWNAEGMNVYFLDSPDYTDCLDLRYLKIENLRITNYTPRNFYMESCNIDYLKVTHSMLAVRTFSDCTLPHATFQDCTFEYPCLHNITLDASRIIDCCFTETTRFSGFKLTNSTVAMTTFKNVDISNTLDFTSTQFISVTLAGSITYDAKAECIGHTDSPFYFVDRELSLRKTLRDDGLMEALDKAKAMW